MNTERFANAYHISFMADTCIVGVAQYSTWRARVHNDQSHDYNNLFARHFNPKVFVKNFTETL